MHRQSSSCAATVTAHGPKPPTFEVAREAPARTGTHPMQHASRSERPRRLPCRVVSIALPDLLSLGRSGPSQRRNASTSRSSSSLQQRCSAPTQPGVYQARRPRRGGSPDPQELRDFVDGFANGHPWSPVGRLAARGNSLTTWRIRSYSSGLCLRARVAQMNGASDSSSVVRRFESPGDTGESEGM